MRAAAVGSGPFQRLADDVRRMSWGQHLAYWLLPAVFLTTATTFYFSGIPALVQIVCPPQNREWGCLENVQLLLLLGICGVALRGARRKPQALLRAGFASIALFAAWVFLEEMDYGAHVAQLFTGEKVSALEELTGVYNLHRQGISDKIYKRSAYGLMLVLFLLAPSMRGRIRHPLLVYLTPSPRISIVAFLAILSDLVPRGILVAGRADGGLGKNIGEFSEVMVYHIFLLYVAQLVFEKEWAETTQPQPAPVSLGPQQSP